MSSPAGKRIPILRRLKFIFSTASSRICWSDSSWMWLKCLVSYKILCAANEQGEHQSRILKMAMIFQDHFLFDLEATQVFYWLFKQSTNNRTAEKVKFQVHNMVWIHLCPKMKPKWTCVNCGKVIGQRARGRWQRDLSWPPNGPSTVQKPLL